MTEGPQIGRRTFLQMSLSGIAGSVVAAGCRARAPASASPRAVFLITIDTFRADHMGAFGYFRDTTPFLDELASRGTLFTNCYAATSITLPAHASMFTGLQLPQHKVFSNKCRGMDPNIRSVTQFLSEKGYETAAFASVSYLGPLERGFSHFEGPEAGPAHAYSNATATVERVIQWLDAKRPADRVFAWVHLFDPHVPYRPPERYAETMRLPSLEAKREAMLHWTGHQHKRYECPPWRGRQDPFIEDHNLYDAEIAYVDDELRRLHTYAEKRGFDNTVWVVTADHGEGMGNHDLQGHSSHIYREQLHVPLIVLRPGEPSPGRRVDTLAHHVDLFPTMLAMAGQKEPPEQVALIEGRSLVPLLEGAAPVVAERLVYSQRRIRPGKRARRSPEREIAYAVYDTERKYIVNGEGRDELYDLGADPFELVNLAQQDSEAGGRLFETASARYQKLTRSGENVTDPGFTEAYDEDLKALGYI